jgi:hypothetical protein
VVRIADHVWILRALPDVLIVKGLGDRKRLAILESSEAGQGDFFRATLLIRKQPE